MSIKAIETNYKGYHFRSRLEARWAVFFDALGVLWEYEPEGFVLPSGGYLPDFYLPGSRLWIEIKPLNSTREDFRKAEEFRNHSGQAIYVGRGDPLNKQGRLFCWDITDGGGGSSDFDPVYLTSSFHEILIVCGVPRERELYCDENMSLPLLQPSDMPVFLGEFEAAALAARGARFEHGQCGAVA